MHLEHVNLQESALSSEWPILNPLAYRNLQTITLPFVAPMQSSVPNDVPTRLDSVGHGPAKHIFLENTQNPAAHN